MAVPYSNTGIENVNVWGDPVWENSFQADIGGSIEFFE